MLSPTRGASARSFELIRMLGDEFAVMPLDFRDRHVVCAGDNSHRHRAAQQLTADRAVRNAYQVRLARGIETGRLDGAEVVAIVGAWIRAPATLATPQQERGVVWAPCGCGFQPGCQGRRDWHTGALDHVLDAKPSAALAALRHQRFWARRGVGAKVADFDCGLRARRRSAPAFRRTAQGSIVCGRRRRRSARAPGPSPQDHVARPLARRGAPCRPAFARPHGSVMRAIGARPPRFSAAVTVAPAEPVDRWPARWSGRAGCRATLRHSCVVDKRRSGLDEQRRRQRTSKGHFALYRTGPCAPRDRARRRAELQPSASTAGSALLGLAAAFGQHARSVDRLRRRFRVSLAVGRNFVVVGDADLLQPLLAATVGGADRPGARALVAPVTRTRPRPKRSQNGFFLIGNLRRAVDVSRLSVRERGVIRCPGPVSGIALGSAEALA